MFLYAGFRFLLLRAGRRKDVAHCIPAHTALSLLAPLLHACAALHFLHFLCLYLYLPICTNW